MKFINITIGIDIPEIRGGKVQTFYSCITILIVKVQCKHIFLILHYLWKIPYFCTTKVYWNAKFIILPGDISSYLSTE